MDYLQLYRTFTEKIHLMTYNTKSWENWGNWEKRETCSSVNSDTSREISVQNGSLFSGAIGHEVVRVSEVISKANDVLNDVPCDDSEIKPSTPRVQATSDIRGKLDELSKQHTLTNRKLVYIVSKLNKLDSIDRKLTRLKSTVTALGQRVKKIEVERGV